MSRTPFQDARRAASAWIAGELCTPAAGRPRPPACRCAGCASRPPFEGATTARLPVDGREMLDRRRLLVLPAAADVTDATARVGSGSVAVRVRE